MRNFYPIMLIIISLVWFDAACNTETKNENAHALVQNKMESPKLSYLFKYDSTDSLRIELILDTLKSEANVIALKLSNGQELPLFSESPRQLHLFKLEMVDLNFDGYGDIKALKEDGATGNTWFDCWLNNPKKKKWIRNEFLSKACSVEVDTLNQKIITNYWGGWADQLLSVYTVTDTTFKLLEDWYIEPGGDTSMIYIKHIKGYNVIGIDSIKTNSSLWAMYKSRNGLK